MLDGDDNLSDAEIESDVVDIGYGEAAEVKPVLDSFVVGIHLVRGPIHLYLRGGGGVTSLDMRRAGGGTSLDMRRVGQGRGGHL